jgi:hypothetical protein
MMFPQKAPAKFRRGTLRSKPSAAQSESRRWAASECKRTYRAEHDTEMKKLVAKLVAAVAAAWVGLVLCAVAAQHKCDPVTDDGWSVVPERQTLNESDSAPYGAGADWFMDRITTVLLAPGGRAASR